MQIAIRNKWISLGGSSIVRDLSEKDLLRVKGKIFTFTAKKFINTLDDKILYIVRNKFWRIFTRKAFILNPEKQVVAIVRRKIFSLHDRYFIEETNYGDFEIMGNILGYNYDIKLNGQVVGHVSRKISLRDSFVLTIDDNADWKFFVALVIAIDNITDRRRQDARSSSYSSSSN